MTTSTLHQVYKVLDVRYVYPPRTVYEIINTNTGDTVAHFDSRSNAEEHAAQLNSENQNNWTDNTIQFARLIAEMEAVGAFTPDVMQDLQRSMDLELSDICELIDRAQLQWEEIKDRISVLDSL